MGQNSMFALHLQTCLFSSKKQAQIQFLPLKIMEKVKQLVFVCWVNLTKMVCSCIVVKTWCVLKISPYPLMNLLVVIGDAH